MAFTTCDTFADCSAGILACGGKGFPYDSVNRKALDPDEVAEYPDGHPHKEALKGFISDNELRKALVDSTPPGCRLVVSITTIHTISPCSSQRRQFLIPAIVELS